MPKSTQEYKRIVPCSVVNLVPKNLCW